MQPHSFPPDRDSDRHSRPERRRRPFEFGEATEPEPVGPDPIALAASIVGQADRDHPADGVIRDALRSAAGLHRDEGGHVARLVFRYYRWRGLIEPGLSLEQQIEATSEIAERFAQRPESFTEAALIRSVPDWVAHHLEVTPAWLRSLQQYPVLWLRARPGTARALSAMLGSTDCRIPDPDLLPDSIRYVGDQDLFRTPAFHAGQFELQDVSSQIVGQLCAPEPKETWWDACAGEGGKTLHLADLLGNQGTVWGTDRAEWRLKRLRLRARRAGVFNVRWATWDGGPKLPVPKRLDGVLVDAPCSGIGTWQRNPQARWTTTPEDIRELAALQKKLLTHAARALRPGGRLVYAVCTLSREETIEVANQFTAEHPEFKPVTAPTDWSSIPPAAGTAANQMWLRPEDRGGNGMFLAFWRRLPAATAAPAPTSTAPAPAPAPAPASVPPPAG